MGGLNLHCQCCSPVPNAATGIPVTVSNFKGKKPGRFNHGSSAVLSNLYNRAKQTKKGAKRC